MGTIFAFVRTTNDPPAESIRLFEDLFVTAAPNAIYQIIERTPNKARYITGHISWLADELRTEIESGFWKVSVPHAELLFRKDVSALWAELISRESREELVSQTSTMH